MLDEFNKIIKQSVLIKPDREFSRKLLENFILKNALNRRKNGHLILEDSRPGRPLSWTKN